jgi:hypothetical protein
MTDDGIDMDVLKSLPSKMIKKIAYHSNVPMDSYNDALKQAIKAKAKTSQINVRGFLTGIPGVEAEIIKIEKMKEGGNLYAPYPLKAQGPFGPKYVDSKTMLSTYSEGQEKKRKDQYRTDMLRPMMQGGGSILNDIGNEHMIIPRNQGTELNIPKYIQAYLQATTNMGKYQDGGALAAMGGIGGIAKMATDLSAGFKKPEKPRDPNEPPLKRFDKGGTSEAMNFYIQNYPGYKNAVKGKYQKGTKTTSVSMPKNSSQTDDTALKLEAEKRWLQSQKQYNNPNLGLIMNKMEDMSNVEKFKKSNDVSDTLEGKGTYRLLYPSTAPVKPYKGTDIVNGIKLTPDQVYKVTEELGNKATHEGMGWIPQNYFSSLQATRKMKNGQDGLEFFDPSNPSETIFISTTPEQEKAGLEWLSKNKKDITSVTNSNKKTAKTIQRNLTPKELTSDKFDTVEKGGQSYKIDPKTKEVFTADGLKITDSNFNRNLLEGYKPKQTVTTQVPNPVTKTREEREEEASTDLISSVVSTGAQLDKQNEQKVRESLNQQTTPVVNEDTKSQGKQVLDKARAGIKSTVNNVLYGDTGEKVKTKLVDFFTRTDEEKEERRQRKLKQEEEKASTSNKNGAKLKRRLYKK